MERLTSKGAFVFARVLHRGAPALQLLAELIPVWVNGLQGRRFMRWGDGEKRFSRPIRWLVALLGDQVVPVSLDGTDPIVLAGNLSRGHRLNKDNVVINSAETYVKDLAAVGVVVERNKRSDFINCSIKSFTINWIWHIRHNIIIFIFNNKWFF